MKWILVLALFAISAFSETVFEEDVEVWAEIDRINQTLTEADELSSDDLELLFQETVEFAVSYELESQFEDLRSDAFETDYFDAIDSYADRAGPAINVFIMGESNNIGVNIPAFLDVSHADTEAYTFFLVSVGGFYVGGERSRIGTAEFPVWMDRTSSSAQASVDSVRSEEWLGYWQIIHPSLDGYFQTIADETILQLSAGVE